MKTISQQVVVFGVSHPTTLQVIRSIGRKNIGVFLVSIGDVKNDILHYSKYVESFVIYKSYVEGINFLQNAEVVGDKPVILVSGDDAALILDSRKEKLRNKYHLPYSSNYSVEYLMKKEVMNKMAADVGLNVPKSIIIRRGEKNPLSYPILLKPAMSVDGSKADIKIIKCDDDLRAYWSGSSLNSVMGTEFIEKDFEVCILCSKLKQAPTRIPGVVKKIRHMPLIYGARSFARILKCENLPMIPYDSICKLIDNTGFYGLMSIELLIKDNKAWFVELNYRADGNMMAYTDAGCNLPYNCYIDSIDEYKSHTHISNAIIKELTVMAEGDIYHVTKYHDLTFFNWMSDLLHTKSFIVLDRYDVKPFLMHTYLDYKTRILRQLKR